jgi:putative membrane protein insertion efficiency factor
MKKGLILLVKIYKKAISPYMIRSCRFSPTCSEYAVEALDRFGSLKGLALAARRVVRCNPFSRGGYDPVPKR